MTTVTTCQRCAWTYQPGSERGPVISLLHHNRAEHPAAVVWPRPLSNMTDEEIVAWEAMAKAGLLRDAITSTDYAAVLAEAVDIVRAAG